VPPNSGEVAVGDFSGRKAVGKFFGVKPKASKPKSDPKFAEVIPPAISLFSGIAPNPGAVSS
jgi:hypothetical protein